MFLRGNKKGFTLLELMIVVIIIGILTSIALPKFFSSVKAARWGAAASMLSTLRSAQLRYHAETGGYATAVNVLDIDIEGTAEWTLAVSGTNATIATVTRSGESFTIDEDGTIGPTKAGYVSGE